MHTHIIIDENLVEDGLVYTGLKTKGNLVDHALRELVKREKKKLF